MSADVDLIGARRLAGRYLPRGRPRPRRHRPLRHRWLRLVAAVTVVAVLVVAVGAGLAYGLSPSVGNAMTLVAQRNRANGADYPGSVPPAKVVAALTATEDASFFSNSGIDAKGVVRGAWGAVTGNADAGGATLEQQLAKILYTGGRSGPLQIVEQLALAEKLDRGYSKDELLQLYLSTVYFGDGAYGLDAAARAYFGTTPAQLDWAQASLLAGLVQAPSAYDPLTHLTLAKQRQAQVLGRLVATDHLTAAQAARVGAQPLGLR